MNPSSTFIQSQKSIAQLAIQLNVIYEGRPLGFSLGEAQVIFGVRESGN